MQDAIMFAIQPLNRDDRVAERQVNLSNGVSFRWGKIPKVGKVDLRCGRRRQAGWRGQPSVFSLAGWRSGESIGQAAALSPPRRFKGSSARESGIGKLVLSGECVS